MLEKDVHCKLSRRCKPPFAKEQVVLLGYKKGSLGYKQNVSGNIASNEKLTAECATFGVSVSTAVTCQGFETLGCHEVADLFVNFPNHALQKRLIAFPVATEESHQAWAKNARNVVTLLKQKAPAGVDDYGASNLAMPRCPHATTALDYRRGSTPASQALVSH
jgi:hypothetical protein